MTNLQNRLFKLLIFQTISLLDLLFYQSKPQQRVIFKNHEGYLIFIKYNSLRIDDISFLNSIT